MIRANAYQSLKSEGFIHCPSCRTPERGSLNSDGQRPSEQKQEIIEALKGRDQDFALSGLCFLRVHIFAGRCPALLNFKAFSLYSSELFVRSQMERG